MKFFYFILSVIFSIFFASLWLWFHRYLLPSPIFADSVGFYSYLPATFIYQDWDMNFFNPHYSFCISETGHIFLRNPIGVAVLMSPFFFLAHGLTLLQSNYPADGYSSFYQIAIYISALFYCVLGLFFTYKILKEKFSENIIIISLFSITFGCGIFFYSTLHAGYSHIYSFFLISVFLYAVIKNKNSYLLGFLLGLIFLARNINILIFLFYIAYNWKNIKITNIFKIALTFFIVLIPQMIYWKIQTGHFLINSYDLKFERLICENNPSACFKDHFDWLKPHIFDNWFSWKKGLFFYYPSLFFAFFGLFCTFKKMRYSILIFLIPMAYLIAAWSDWSYGFSFGQRAYVDYMSIFAILIASYLNKVKNTKIYNISICLIIFLTICSFSMMLMLYCGNCSDDGSVLLHLGF